MKAEANPLRRLGDILMPGIDVLNNAAAPLDVLRKRPGDRPSTAIQLVSQIAGRRSMIDFV